MKLRIRQLRRERGLTLEELAELAGISRSYLNELELGAKTINANRLEQVARALEVPPESLFVASLTPISIAGRVGAGAQVPLVDAHEKGDGLYHVACPPQLSPHGIVAVEVEGDSMAPMYQPGHVLFFTRANHEGVAEEDIGLPCIIEDADGMAWVKLLKRGSAPGLFHLISLNPSADSVWDKPIKWAARVKLALPKELSQRI